MVATVVLGWLCIVAVIAALVLWERDRFLEREQAREAELAECIEDRDDSKPKVLSMPDKLFQRDAELAACIAERDDLGCDHGDYAAWLYECTMSLNDCQTDVLECHHPELRDEVGP